MKKRILFITPSLYGGGAERVLVLLLRHLDRSRFQPVVVLFEPENDYKEDIPDDVRIVSLNSSGMLDSARLILSLSQLLKKEAPDIICTSIYRVKPLSLITALAMRLSRVKARVFLTEHGNLSWCMKTAKLASLRGFLIRNKFLYPEKDNVICVSKGLRDDLVNNWGVSAARTKIIYNPVEIDRIQILAKEEVDHHWFQERRPVIIACGRLDRQKDYPLLLRVFASVSKEASDLRLVILGDGLLRKELIEYTGVLGISDKTAFLGFQKNPFKYIARAKALVLSSVMEGFPMVLIEAMACGTPVISTRCESGPEELITDGVDGLLTPVGDVDAMGNAIHSLLRDEFLRIRLAEAGRRRVEDFRAEKITAEYERMFE
ncbi:MAG: glycosyltransferase [Deltaproteobacteria bacterium]|nr:glycosyltransferase [Deltaproteobacteria bacterium]